MEIGRKKEERLKILLNETFIKDRLKCLSK